MRKAIKIGFPIVCIGVITITFWMMSDIKKKAQENKDESVKNEIVVNENTVENKNETENKIDDENSVDTGNLGKTDNSIINARDEKNFEIAIGILRKNITEKDVYYTKEGVENGRYIVAVRDSNTTIAKQYYIIDIETNEFEIYY